jgi:hypothetical protein
MQLGGQVLHKIPLSDPPITDQNVSMDAVVSGISNLTKIDCSEHVGVIFLLCCVMSFAEFHDALEAAYKQKNNNACHWVKGNDVKDALECLLIYNKLVTKQSHWKLDDAQAPSKYHTKIVELLEDLKMALSRTKGLGWKVSKFHEQLHIIADMILFGSPINVNASTGGESNTPSLMQEIRLLGPRTAMIPWKS